MQELDEHQANNWLANLSITLDVKASERWLIMGKTGSGKTQFAKFLLREISKKMRVVIVDTKHFWLEENPIWEKHNWLLKAIGKQLPGTVDKPHLVKRYNPDFRVQVIQPEMYDRDFERFCLDVLKFRHCYFYIDESDGIASATSVPLGLLRIWKQGRALKVGAAEGSQTYSGIPRIFKSQAEKFVLFKVGMEDIENAAKLMHVSNEEVENLGDYEYLYLDTKTMDRAIWMPPIEIEKVA